MYLHFRRCIVQGSMSQADVSTCDSAIATGMQCTCTSLVYLCLTINSPLVNPSSSDIDRIVFDGTDTIHKYFAGKPRYLSIDELLAYQVIRGKRWQDIQTCRQTKEMIKDRCCRRKSDLLRLPRQTLRLVIGVLTGHVRLNRHLVLWDWLKTHYVTSVVWQ